MKILKAAKGFTLIEILVAVSIVSILFVTVTPQMDNSFNTAQESTVKTDFMIFSYSSEMYLKDTAGYNLNASDLSDYLGNEHNLSNNGTTIITNSTDPWGNPYTVELNNQQIVFQSYGKNEIPNDESYFLVSYISDEKTDSCTSGFRSKDLKLTKLDAIPNGFTCGDVLATSNANMQAPSSFVATNVTESTANFVWGSVANATSYILSRDGTIVYSGSATSFEDTGLTPSTGYSYTVVATNGTDTSSPLSLNVTTASVIGSPATPSGFTYNNLLDDSVDLTWNTVSNATGYEIRRGGTVVYTGTANSFSDIGLTYNTDYTYSLIAYNSTGESSPVTLSLKTKLMPVGEGSSVNPYIIYTDQQLQRVSGCLTCDFELGQNIDASATSSWNAGRGFLPIVDDLGDADPSNDVYFTGSLDGKGFSINNLYINEPNKDYIGLFDYIDTNATVQNMSFQNANITGKDFVGTLAGGIATYLTIDNIAVDGTVNGDWSVGGLAGSNGAAINNITSTSTVNGITTVGGVIGDNNGPLTDIISSAQVTSTADFGGGIVGYTRSDLENSTVTSSARVNGANHTGGAIGYASLTSSVFNVHSEATVNGDYFVGGIIGTNYGNATNLTGMTNITGNSSLGGIIGHNQSTVLNLTAQTGTIVNGTTDVGGVIGYQYAGFDTSYLTSDAEVIGDNNVGGIIGSNYGTGHDLTSNAVVTGFIENIGGVVGMNAEWLGDILADTNIEAPNAFYVGGAIGYNEAYVESITVTSTINADSYAGGIIGENYGTLISSNSSGSINGYEEIGGAVGANQNLVESTTSTTNVTGSHQIGGIVGDNDGTVRTSSANGVITGVSSSGGLVGSNDGLVIESEAAGTVYGNEDVGGAVGRNTYEVDQVTSSSTVYGTSGGLGGIGGLVGYSYGSPTTVIRNSFATGSVSGVEYVGGLIGDISSTAAVINSYSTGSVLGSTTNYIGGLIGYRESTATVTSSYYDSTTSGQSDTGKGTARTTAQMTQQSTYVGWDFTTIWGRNLAINGGRPYLVSMTPTAPM